MSSQTKAIVAGGGIGGLTAALCLAARGLNVQLLEQAERFTEAGAGIQVSPNASRVLHHLGLESALTEVGFLPQAVQFRHWRSGALINETPLGKTAEEKYGAPYYHIHRGDLLAVLLTAAEKNDSIELLPGTSLLSAEQRASEVIAETSAGALHGDFLIGADGIHSTVRKILWGDSAPRFTGCVAWRALVPAARLPEGLIRPMSTAWWGPGKHFVHYYVKRGELVNCVCVVEKPGWEVESWTEPGEHSELKRDFAGWHPTIQTLIEQADPASLYKWALFDRNPMTQWSQDHITLLGDACHPTLPFMAQGAAMAIEDAAVLADCIANATDLNLALRKYETLRIPRTRGIQLGSRRNADIFHLSGVKAWLRNRAVRVAGAKATDTLYRYNALTAAQ